MQPPIWPRHRFSMLKPGSIFINTSRGAVVCEEALRAGRNKLLSIVLDVWGNEPEIHDDTLAAAEIATPRYRRIFV